MFHFNILLDVQLMKFYKKNVFCCIYTDVGGRFQLDNFRLLEINVN